MLPLPDVIKNKPHAKIKSTIIPYCDIQLCFSPPKIIVTVIVGFHMAGKPTVYVCTLLK